MLSGAPLTASNKGKQRYYCCDSQQHGRGLRYPHRLEHIENSSALSIPETISPPPQIPHPQTLRSTPFESGRSSQLFALS